MNEIKIKSYIITILITISLITVSFFIGDASKDRRLSDLEKDLAESRAIIVAERDRIGWITRESYEAKREIYRANETIGSLRESVRWLENQNRQNISSIRDIRGRNNKDIEKVRSVIEGLDKYIHKTEIKN